MMRNAFFFLLPLAIAASACDGSTSGPGAGRSTTPASSGTPSAGASVDSRRGGSYTGNITCGNTRGHAVQLGANETLRVTFRATITGVEPLGEDIAWRWLGPTNVVLDTNALPVPTPGGAPVEQSWDVRATDPGRYTLALVVEDGAACAHAAYTVELH